MYMFTYISTYIHTCTSYMYVLYTCISYMYVCIYRYVGICTYIYTYIHIYLKSGYLFIFIPIYHLSVKPWAHTVNYSSDIKPQNSFQPPLFSDLELPSQEIRNLSPFLYIMLYSLLNPSIYTPTSIS